MTKRRASSSTSKSWHRRVKNVSVDLAEGIYRSLDTALSRSLADALREKRYVDIVSTQVKPALYDDPQLFRDDYLACELMSKFPSWDLGIDRDQVALQKFAEAETICEEANHRLARPLEDSVHGATSLEAYIFVARAKIRSLLRSFSWDRCSLHFGHGPGGTFSTPRKLGDAYYKFGCKKPTTTKANLGLAYAALCSVPTWFKHVTGWSGEVTPDVFRDLSAYADEFFELVPGNKVITVPKNAKTNRTIAKEPLMNQYIQSGIGGEIRRKLKLVGIDLNDQSINQRLAFDGSVNGTLATMDLSMASDSVSMELVRLLLPEDWVTAIELCRSPFGILPSGDRIFYQKVSSMGNGFTFELESLIFWALVSAVVQQTGDMETRVGVYGDDLIFSVDAYREVERLLLACGFQPNEKKSFKDGPFRESCGKHYFRGLDVTPFYVRKDVNTLETLVLAANSIRQWAFRRSLGWSLDGRLQGPYRLMTDSIFKVAPVPVGPAAVLSNSSLARTYCSSKWLRCSQIASSPGISPRDPDVVPVKEITTVDVISGYLIGDWDECRPARARKGLDGWYGEIVVSRPRLSVYSDLPFLTRGLATLEGGSGSANVVSDDSAGECRTVKVLHQWWPSRGPWA